MIIIQVEGGLGNQMFQYALYLSFISKGIKGKLDISKFENYKLHNGYELENIFSVNADYCTQAEKKIIKSLSKAAYVVIQRPYKEKEDWQWTYHKEVSELRSGFLKGYWQSEKYFSGIAEKIREKFVFPPLKDDRNKEALSKIVNSNSVSLHIRRGDYLQGRNCVVGPAYHQSAISMIDKKVDVPVYFIFSDDIEWAKKNIKVNKSYFIDWNTGAGSFIDMQLMSQCRHNIIANSSFSWWGAWLNQNPGKLVTAPMPWMPHLEAGRNILPEEWILIPAGFL